MAKVILSAEGQTLDLPDDIAGDDSKLRQALVTYYPQLATAKIERISDATGMRVTVSKQAGPKGARKPKLTGDSFIDALIAAPEHINPAVKLWDELGADGTEPDGLPLGELALLGDLIEQTTRQAEAEMLAVQGVFDALRDAAPIPAAGTPEGF